MKIPRHELDALLELIRQHPLPFTWQAYKAAGRSRRRWIFDHLWAIPNAHRHPWVDRQYAAGCNDDHIFSALKWAIHRKENLCE